MATNEILPFAQGGGANVQSQIDYAAEPLRSSGNVAGIARSNVNNKALRQASVLAAGLAQFMADNQSNNIVDTASIANLAAWLGDAVRAANNAATVIGTSRNASMYNSEASATGTFTCDELIVGASIGGRQWRLSSLSLPINLGTTGAGGMDTGLAPVSGYVALYVIYNPSTNTASMLAQNTTSTRATEVYSGSNMPAGYTASALVAVLPTNASRQIVRHVLRDRRVAIEGVNVLTSSTQRPSATSLSISSGVPINARTARIAMNIGSSVAVSAFALNIGSDVNMIGASGVGSTITSGTVNPALTVTSDVVIVASTPQTIYYTATVSAGTMSLNLFVSGYEF